MIAKRKKITLINDGCHALGSAINNNINYAIKYADFVTYSFHPVKPITTGEGGAILTNNKKVDEKIKILRTHGIKKNIKKNIWFYDMKFLGFNYRITDFQCALGIGQLRKIEKFNTEILYVTAIYVLVGVLRYMQITFVFNKSDDPSKVFFSDKFTIINLLLWIFSFYLIVNL